MKLSSVETIIRALNAQGVRYLVVGGLAVNAHGYGRNTYDLDLVIGLDHGNITLAFSALEEIGYKPILPVTAQQFADIQQREQWQRDKGMIVLTMHSDIHRETPVDLFVHEPFDFDEEYASAYRQQLAPGVEVPLLCIETLLAMKQVSGRPKDLADLDELNLLHGRFSSYDKPRR